MKNHLKRISAPKTWVISRKREVFIVRPHSGSHNLGMGMALGVLLRDYLHLALTMAQVKKILISQEVFVNGRRQRDHRFFTGLFDVIALPSMKQYFRVTLDHKGRLTLLSVPETEVELRPSKIVGKTMLAKGQIQFHLDNGNNVIGLHKANVGDSFLFNFKTGEIKNIFYLKFGAAVFLTNGKHSGSLGLLKSLRGKEAVFVVNGDDVETSKDYLFVVGEKEPAVLVNKLTASRGTY